jgi:hypothetical protein
MHLAPPHAGQLCSGSAEAGARAERRGTVPAVARAGTLGARAARKEALAHFGNDLDF